MASPSPVITSAERGTPGDLVFSASRLAAVARIAYGEAGYPRLPLSAEGPPFDVLFSAVLSRVYRTPSPEASGRLYTADLLPFARAVEGAGRGWLERALPENTRTLDRLQASLVVPATFARLRAGAVQYFEVFHALPAADVAVAPIVGSRAGTLRYEPPKAREARERAAAALVNDDLVKILGAHPRRFSIFLSLAGGEAEGRTMLDTVFLDARAGIAKFGAAIRAEPGHLWRYPPIVVAALDELGLLQSRAIDQTLLARFALDYARLRSQGLWDRLATTAGIAVALAAIVVGGPVGLVLGALDVAISGMTAYRDWELAREKGMAAAASALSEGRPFTDEPADYGDAFLAGAAALLAAIQVVSSGVRVFREAKAAREAVDTVAAGTRVTESLPPRGFQPTDEGRALLRGSEDVRIPRKTEPVELPADTGPLTKEGALETLGQPAASSAGDVRKVRRVSNLQSSAERQHPRSVGEETRRRREREHGIARLEELRDNGVISQDAELTGRTGGRKVTPEEQLYGVPSAEVWASIRGRTPSDEIKQWAQQKLPVNAPDPAFPGRFLTEPAHADHIVPVDYIRGMPGFAQLDAAAQLEVLNFRPNFEPLSGLANTSKGNRLPSQWLRHDALDLPVDEAYRQILIAKEQQLIPALQSEISRLLRQHLTTVAH